MGEGAGGSPTGEPLPFFLTTVCDQPGTLGRPQAPTQQRTFGSQVGRPLPAKRRRWSSWAPGRASSAWCSHRGLGSSRFPSSVRVFFSFRSHPVVCLHKSSPPPMQFTIHSIARVVQSGPRVVASAWHRSIPPPSHGDALAVGRFAGAAPSSRTTTPPSSNSSNATSTATTPTPKTVRRPLPPSVNPLVVSPQGAGGSR